MGLDMYIDARRNIGTPNEERDEKIYWRKFWDLQREIAFLTDAKVEDGYIPDTRITREDLDAIIDYCGRNRDFFGNFDTIVPLCELRAELPELEEEGWTLWYNSNW